MQKKQAETLGDVLNQYMKALGLENKIKEMQEMRALNGWEKVVGPVIAKNTFSISLSAGILDVKFRSPLVKNEIKMHKTIIIEKLNEIVGEAFIKDLKIR